MEKAPSDRHGEPGRRTDRHDTNVTGYCEGRSAIRALGSTGKEGPNQAGTLSSRESKGVSREQALKLLSSTPTGNDVAGNTITAALAVWSVSREEIPCAKPNRNGRPKNSCST